MNTIQSNNGSENKNRKSAFDYALNTCKDVLAQIKNVKETILTEARNTFEAPEQLLRLALSEAEALAFQTRYPQLVFADLAEEKIQRTAAWSERQRLLD
jgi:hypothetical protein